MREGAGLREIREKDDPIKTRTRNKRQARSRAGGQITMRSTARLRIPGFFFFPSDEEAG